MTINPYVNNYTSVAEQTLLDNLIIESIQFYGMDMYYCPRTLTNYDDIFDVADVVEYNQAISVEFYIKNVDGEGFGGEVNYLSKFAGLEIREQATFAVSKTRFANVVIEAANEELVRPREGDLIYFPLVGKVFQIKYVDKYELFFQLGALQTWDVTVELFEYSSERLRTGITAIDSLEALYSDDVYFWALKTEGGNPLTTQSNNVIVSEGYEANTADTQDDSNELEQESDQFIDFSEKDPFSLGNYAYKVFINKDRIQKNFMKGKISKWNYEEVSSSTFGMTGSMVDIT